MEQELLEQFFENNKELFLATIDAVMDSDDYELSSEEREKLSKVVEVLSQTTDRRDRTKYRFDNNVDLPKGRFVLEIVKDYVKHHPDVTIQELEEAFPKEVQGSLGVIKEYNSIPEKYIDRFFTKEEELIILSKENIKVAVCTNWTKKTMDKFKELIDQLGYEDRYSEM